MALLLAFFCLIVFINYRVDKYGVLQGGRYERQVVELLQAGNAIAGYTEQLDEREIMRLYIQTMEKKDYLVLGSSRGLQITEEYVPSGSSFFNLGVSGSDFRDLLGMYYLLVKNDKLPKHLILELDPWLLYDSPDAVNKHADLELYKEFLAEELGFSIEYEKPNYDVQLEVLFSPSIFQENIAYYFRDRTGEDTPVAAQGDWMRQATTLRLPDGSQLYDTTLRGRSQDEIDFEALNLINNAFFRVEGFSRLDTGLQEQLEAFIRHAKKQGVSITFVLTPYHPTCYELALEQPGRFPAFFEVENYYRALAKREGISVYGSYDPLVSGCTSADFYDGLHIKREALYKAFCGFDGSRMRQKYLTEQKRQQQAFEKIVQLREKGIAEAWMDEFEAFLNRPKTARMPA